MNHDLLKGNLITGLFFTAGILSLVTSQFILSTALFGMACLAKASNIRPAKLKPVRV